MEILSTLFCWAAHSYQTLIIMTAVQTRIIEAASEVARILLSLVRDVDKQGHDDVTRLLGRVQQAFEGAAPASVDVFNDPGDDLRGVI